jgi:rhodanese-related sulfurtransferase
MSGLPRIRWTPNRALAALAIALGLLATAGRPTAGHTVRIDTQELATIVAGKVDHVTVEELADWIIRDASDYRLVDVRTPEEFAAYHIPTAENVPLADLPDAGLGRDEKIVLYSEGGIHSAQAWMLMRAERYPGVYILSGGLDAWKDEVLYPVATADSTPTARVEFERAAQVARHFGGAPRRAAATANAPLVLESAPAAPAAPQLEAPRSSAAGRPATKGKKKEGC